MFSDFKICWSFICIVYFKWYWNVFSHGSSKILLAKSSWSWTEMFFITWFFEDFVKIFLCWRIADQFVTLLFFWTLIIGSLVVKAFPSNVGGSLRQVTLSFIWMWFIGSPVVKGLPIYDRGSLHQVCMKFFVTANGDTLHRAWDFHLPSTWTIGWNRF